MWYRAYTPSLRRPILILEGVQPIGNSAALNNFRSYIPDLEENIHSRIYSMFVTLYIIIITIIIVTFFPQKFCGGYLLVN